MKTRRREPQVTVKQNSDGIHEWKAEIVDSRLRYAANTLGAELVGSLMVFEQRGTSTESFLAWDAGRRAGRKLQAMYDAAMKARER